MKIDKIFLDFDDTMVDSSKVIVELLNRRFGTHEDVANLNTWNYTNLFPTIKGIEIEELFDSAEFFELLEWKEGAADFINKFHDIITIVSKGNEMNLYRKEMWIRKTFPDIKFIGIEPDVSKSTVEMGMGDCIIDDHAENLIHSTAQMRIMFESFKHVEWNEEFYSVCEDKIFMRAYTYIVQNYISDNWKEIENIVMENMK